MRKKPTDFRIGSNIANYLQIIRHLEATVDFIRDKDAPILQPIHANSKDISERILKLLLTREFNHQSRSKIEHLLPKAQQNLQKQIANNTPLKFYLDYGGGYHASTDPKFRRPLSFEPGVAELMLVRQIVSLKRKLVPIYLPGINFNIVIDNAFAHYVNDIPVAKTISYCEKFRVLLAALGVDQFIKVLPQSEISNFSQKVDQIKSIPSLTVSSEQLRNIQRFLGRHCTEKEACERLGRYAVAEKLWEPELCALTAGGIRFLQRESNNFLSFRSFIGGATRVQCGLLGFKAEGKKLVPMLITTTTHQSEKVVRVSVNLRHLLNRHSTKANSSIQLQQREYSI